MKTKCLASEWNGMLDAVKRNRILGVTDLSGGGWRHPWSVRATWDVKASKWTASILPGFVNHLPATVLGEDAEGAPVDIPITETHAVPLTNFRALGSDGEATGSTTAADGSVRVTFDQVPEYFRALGVGAPPEIVLDGGALPVPVASSTARLLRACDLVLHMDRLAAATQWTQGAGVDGLVAEFTVTTMARPDARRAAYIRPSVRWQPSTGGTLQDLVAGNWADSPTDQYLLATVYFVSPRGAETGSAPDERWTPYVKQGADFFWNLAHATNVLRAPLSRQTLTLNTGLAGGVGDALNNFILSQVNNEASAAAEFIGRERIESRMWTV